MIKITQQTAQEQLTEDNVAISYWENTSKQWILLDKYANEEIDSGIFPGPVNFHDALVLREQQKKKDYNTKLDASLKEMISNTLRESCENFETDIAEDIISGTLFVEDLIKKIKANSTKILIELVEV